MFSSVKQPDHFLYQVHTVLLGDQMRPIPLDEEHHIPACVSCVIKYPLLYSPQGARHEALLLMDMETYQVHKTSVYLPSQMWRMFYVSANNPATSFQFPDAENSM